MKEEIYTPDIVDFAYQIIAMDKENQHLRHELEHYKELNEINSNALNNSMDSTKETIGIIVGAVLDPDSALNKGSAALAREVCHGK
jgi:hypothetical protein